MGKPDVSMTLNGSLTDLVAITAGCDSASNDSAIVISMAIDRTVGLRVSGQERLDGLDMHGHGMTRPFRLPDRWLKKPIQYTTPRS